MGFSKSLISLMVVFTVVCSFMVEETKAQEADCASNLIPCANYLNSTKPPESCCKPLRETVEKQRVCLCNLFNNPATLKSFGINITQALQLPISCGVSSDTTACNKTSSPSPTASRTPPPSPPPPPGVPGSGASKMALTGVSTILLFWASVMAY